MQLAALALPSHPHPFARIPEPPTVEHVEARTPVGRGTMTRVQPGYARANCREDLVVAGRRFRRGVDPVGDEREPHVAVGVREIVHFHLIDLIVDVDEPGQQRRYHHQRAKLRRHAGCPLESRQEIRCHDCGDEPIQQCDGEIRCRYHRNHAQHDQPRERDMSCGDVQWNGENSRREEDERAQICRRGGVDQSAPQSKGDRGTEAHRTLEAPPAIAHEIEPGVGFAGAGCLPLFRRLRSHALGVRQRIPRHIEFRAPRPTRDRFDRVPIAVAAREVHLPEIAPGAELLVHEAHALEERGPVECRHQPHARDDVPHRHRHRRLPLVLHQRDFVGRRPLRREPLVQPRQGGRHGGILVA